MLMVLLIVAMTVASGLLTRQNYTTGSFREKLVHADYAVRAAVSTAMAEMTKDPAWAPTDASPHREYLDPHDMVGFEVWIDTNNESGTGPQPSKQGFDLEPGQALLGARALINGEVVTGGYSGAETRLIIERPQVEFSHAIFKTTDGALPLNSGGLDLLSYNSLTGILPFNGLPGTPPTDNQRSSVRGLDDVNLNNTRVFGEMVLPTGAQITTGAGSSYLTERRLDDAYLPRKFTQRGWLAGGTPTTGIIPPGDYDGGNIPSGETISLVRGGVYYFSSTFTLQDNVTVNLTGPVSDGPVQVFTHGFEIGPNCRVNLPAPGIAPKPSDFQVYAISQPGCDIALINLRNGTEAALVISMPSGRLSLFNNVTLYGAINGPEMTFGSGVEIHYDEALLGQVFNVKTEWVLVSRGVR